MEKVREDLLKILNQALELEHAAGIQYSSRAEMIASTLAKIEKAHRIQGAKEIMGINLQDEKEAIAFYKLIHRKVGEYRRKLLLEFESLEWEMRNVINDEQQHLERLSLVVRQLEEKIEEKRRYECFSVTEGVSA